MKVNLELKMSRKIYEMSCKPLRSRKKLILLLLYTIRQLYSNVEIDEEFGSMIIHVDKERRIIYVLPDKIFSCQFPFTVKKGEFIEIYDYSTGVYIDSLMLSLMIGFFETVDERCETIETLLSKVLDLDFPSEKGYEGFWEMIQFLYQFDLGYFRYDYDEKNEMGDVHPLNHLDIFFDNGAVIKVGTDRRYTEKDIIKLISHDAGCYYLKC